MIDATIMTDEPDMLRKYCAHRKTSIMKSTCAGMCITHILIVMVVAVKMILTSEVDGNNAENQVFFAFENDNDK